MGPDLAAAAAYARSELEAGLPAHLTYHDIGHTADDVVPAARRLARAEGVTGHAEILLLTAAWFHDLGFIVQADGHEAIGVEIARRVLPAMGYDDADLAVIDGLIGATKMPQQPRSDLARILADADLDVLGRADFIDRNVALRRELATRDTRYTDREWLDVQIAFLGEHRYFTASARRRRDAAKQRHLDAMRQERAGAS